MRRFAIAIALGALAVATPTPASQTTQYTVGRVIDGDTVEVYVWTVRLVQIDSPNVSQCYGRQARATLRRLLPKESFVRLYTEPVAGRRDLDGHLLRYVVETENYSNVNFRLVAIGAAAPYFENRRRGRYAKRLETLAKRARAKKLGLWDACPGTVYDPYHRVETHL